jgi:L-lactate utilization protein LutC
MPSIVPSTSPIIWKEKYMLPIQRDFVTPATEETLQQVAERMRERNIEVVIVNNGEEARQAALERIPKGAEVHSGKSKTLLDSGIFDAIMDPDRFNALRHQMLKMDRKTQGKEIRKLIAAPDFMLGSVNAITEAGVLVIASATSSQIGPYSNTAGKLLLVVGSQKIVPDLEAAFRRIREHVQPWEEEQVRKAANMGTFVGKILIIEREWVKERMTVILVREPIGI